MLEDTAYVDRVAKTLQMPVRGQPEGGTARYHCRYLIDQGHNFDDTQPTM